MKDNRLRTAHDNYEAFDVIAGSNYGGWSDRDICCAIVDFMVGNFSDMPRATELFEELAKSSDEDIANGYVEDYTAEIQEYFIDNEEYLYPEWRDNELILLPQVDYATETHKDENRISDELPEPDSTHHCGETWVIVNERGNTSLYRFLDTVTGWQEVWAVV